ncbi:MAG TPA: hypothetical protein DEV93_03660 [Chloroflexi bacterium]|jgi:hypothetical protein|nr:hypothetical protein [Chloroflexota bacterium]
MRLADLQAWLTAIGTVIGAIGTVGAFAVALYLLSIQMRDRRADAQERLLGQARLVAAWIADISEQPYQKDGDPVFYDITVHAYNASTEPVYNVVIKTEVGVRGSFVRRPFVLGPGDRREFSIVAPGYPRGQPAVAISFVDSAGRQWMRRPTGTLHQPLPDELVMQNTEEPGAYPSIAEHPTLKSGHTLDLDRGRRVTG